MGAAVKRDGEIVGTVEVYTDGFNEGFTVGAAVKRDGAVVGNVVVYNDGIIEGIAVGAAVKRDGTEVEIIVGWGITVLSWKEQFCCSTQNLFWQVAKGLQHCELETHPHCA